MASSLQLKKRRPAASAPMSAEEPPSKRAKREEGGTRQSKEKMIKMNKEGRKKKAKYEDDDFQEDDDFAPEEKPTKKQSGGKKGGAGAGGGITPDWSAANLKKVRQLVLKYPGCNVENMYQLTPPSLQKTKTLGQFRAVVACFLYLALETVAGGTSGDRKTQEKFGKMLKKLMSVHHAMIADFKSLSFTPQPKSSIKDSKKPVKISLLDRGGKGDEVVTVEPGEELSVRLVMAEGMFEPQKVVYFEIVGKIPFYCDDVGKLSDTRFYFQRVKGEEGGGRRRGRGEEAILEVRAPGCPGEYTMKCVKMYLKETMKDYKHIVCGQLGFRVGMGEGMREGIGMTGRTGGMIVGRGVCMETVQYLAQNSDAVPSLSKLVCFFFCFFFVFYFVLFGLVCFVLFCFVLFCFVLFCFVLFAYSIICLFFWIQLILPCRSLSGGGRVKTIKTSLKDTRNMVTNPLTKSKKIRSLDSLRRRSLLV